MFDRCDREVFDLLAGHPVFRECVGPFVADVADMGFNPSESNCCEFSESS